jgi:subtilisin family serine protease
MAAGSPRKIELDSAVKDIQARATTTGNVGPGGNGLWHLPNNDGNLSQVGNATGQGVIVAIIDTGIDYTHTMFMKQLEPTKASRIIRIWDQGLSPSSLSECPDASLLASSQTYGVEYNNDHQQSGHDQIDTALNGGTAIQHKDCNGHGTHVASIAAGGVVFPSGEDRSKVGVAPEADIIAVKYIDVPETIKYRTTSGFGAQVGHTARFRDAVLYCLRTARALSRPIVINMSFGNSSEAGDGLDDDARWIDEVMDPTHSSGPLNFPEGAIIVKAAGNEGSSSRRQVARIKVPSSGEIIVPMELKDTRGTQQTKRKNCKHELHKPPIGVDFWYRRASPFTAVEFALRLPHRSDFSGDMSVGGFLDRGFVVRSGSPTTIGYVNWGSTVHSAYVRHGGEPSVPHPDGGSVRRHKVSFWVEPKVRSGTVSYYPAIYEMRIKAPAGTEIFAMCDTSSWGPGLGVKFEIADKMMDGSAPSPSIDVVPEFTPAALAREGITVSSEFSAGDTLGRYALTVAAYNDTDGDIYEAGYRAIATFSSRGPLRDYSNPSGSLSLIADKPDISAPGVKINAALSIESDEGFWVWLTHLMSSEPNTDFIEKSGTSMAAPMVAGVVALLLDKKPDLTITEVLTLLSNAASNGTSPAAPSTGHDNAYGSGIVDALESHTNTP